MHVRQVLGVVFPFCVAWYTFHPRIFGCCTYKHIQTHEHTYIFTHTNTHTHTHTREYMIKAKRSGVYHARYDLIAMYRQINIHTRTIQSACWRWCRQAFHKVELCKRALSQEQDRTDMVHLKFQHIPSSHEMYMLSWQQNIFYMLAKLGKLSQNFCDLSRETSISLTSNIYIYIYIYMRMCVCIYIYEWTHTLTHTHTCTRL
jgi:hypothetical protein